MLKKGNSIKDKIIRDTRALFESDEENYYKPVKIGNALMIIFMNIKLMEIKTKHYQLKNILMRLDHI